MHWEIIDCDGKPLRDIDGNPILCASKHEAQQFLRPGERVRKWRLPPSGE